MRKRRRARKRQLERLFQQKAAENHEVVAVAVLRLHDHGGA
jgi:transcription termination factor NusB